MPKSPQLPGHRIEDISYSRDRLLCTCGATMRARGGVDWLEHRRDIGLKTPGVHQGAWTRT